MLSVKPKKPIQIWLVVLYKFINDVKFENDKPIFQATLKPDHFELT
jgi:hypothetical protein